MRGTHPLHRPAVVQRRAADRAEQIVAARARRQRDDDVARVDDLARGTRQAPGIEEAEQQVAHLDVRLLDLVDEQDRDGLLEGGEERCCRCMAGVAGRRAEQPRDLDRVRQLRAVEPEDRGALEAERRERARSASTVLVLPTPVGPASSTEPGRAGCRLVSCATVTLATRSSAASCPWTTLASSAVSAAVVRRVGARARAFFRPDPPPRCRAPASHRGRMDRGRRGRRCRCTPGYPSRPRL